MKDVESMVKLERDSIEDGDMEVLLSIDIPLLQLHQPQDAQPLSPGDINENSGGIRASSRRALMGIWSSSLTLNIARCHFFTCCASWTGLLLDIRMVRQRFT